MPRQSGKLTGRRSSALEKRKRTEWCRELFERGSYLLILEVGRSRVLRVGSLGRLTFPVGYYVYAGSARRAMRARIERHMALRKKKWWHVDWLTTGSASTTIAVAVTERTGLECRLSSLISKKADSQVKGFGSSDCRCPSHLSYFSDFADVAVALQRATRYDLVIEYGIGNDVTVCYPASVANAGRS